MLPAMIQMWGRGPKSEARQTNPQSHDPLWLQVTTRWQWRSSSPCPWPPLPTKLPDQPSTPDTLPPPHPQPGKQTNAPDLKSWHFAILNRYLPVLLWVTWELENGWKFPSNGSCLKTTEHCVETKRKMPKSNRHLSQKLIKSPFPHLLDEGMVPSYPCGFFQWCLQTKRRMTPAQHVRGRTGVRAPQSVCCWVWFKVTRNSKPEFIHSLSLQASISCSEIFQGLSQNIPDCFYPEIELSRINPWSDFIMRLFLPKNWLMDEGRK